MSYKPSQYWRQRKELNSKPLYAYAADYITRHIKSAKTILDFGIGDGRLFPLYRTKDVKGYDIVRRLHGVQYLDTLEGSFDAIIASKVLLHISPQKIEQTIRKLQDMSYKIIVYDTVGPCNNIHNFAHDFKQYGIMDDVIIKHNDLLFVYD